MSRLTAISSQKTVEHFPRLTVIHSISTPQHASPAGALLEANRDVNRDLLRHDPIVQWDVANDSAAWPLAGAGLAASWPLKEGASA